MNIFYYKRHGNKLTITGLKEDVADTSIVIPETIDGMPVVEIAEHAFRGTPLTNVWIGENITKVGHSAFSDCHCLISVTWNTHCEIPSCCFYNCTSMSKFDFSNVSTIGNLAFAESGLKEIFLPENIKTVGVQAFCGCIKLEKVIWNCFCEYVPSSCFTECFELKHFDFTNVQRIGAGAFYKSGLQELYLPKNVKGIGVRAFAECINLKQVHWNCECKEIPTQCFGGDSSLHYFDFVNVKKLQTQSFERSGLKEVSLNKGIEVGKFCFALCDSLEKVEWLSGRAIKGSIFEGCKNIKEIFISDNVKSIEASAFASSQNAEIAFI